MKIKEKEIIKRVWEREEGIKSAFYNACEMFLMLKRNEKGNERYLDILWGGIVGVLTCSGVNEYIDLELNLKDNSIEVGYELNNEFIILDSFKYGDIWVDYYYNGTVEYWEMENF